jgi:hypothetical protein
MKKRIASWIPWMAFSSLILSGWGFVVWDRFIARGPGGSSAHGESDSEEPGEDGPDDGEFDRRYLSSA